MKPYGTTTFCDDIRTENNGKHLYIGVYQDAIISEQDFPLVLPTFAMAIKVLEPIEDRGRDLIIKVLGTENFSEPILEIQLPNDRWNAIEHPEFDRESHYIGSLFIVKVAGFALNGPGILKVRAYRDSEEFRLGSIRVSQKSTDS